MTTTTTTTTLTRSYTEVGAPSSSPIELKRRNSHAKRVSADLQATFRQDTNDLDNEDIRNDVPSPVTAQPVVQRWNYPRGNIGRVFAAFFSFFIAGMNDAAVGALIPYLETYYSLSYTIISLIFLTPFAGYSLAAFFNAQVHTRLGQRGIAIIAPLCHIATYAILSAHPPFPVIVVANAISGVGNGLLDAAWSSWIGKMDKANAVQGCLHSFYSLGATFAPLIATSMTAQAGLPWYSFYYVMVGASVLELIGSTMAFWNKTGRVYVHDNPRDSQSQGGRTKEALSNKITWLCAIYFFTYMAVEVSLGGWIVTFMLRVRKATHYASGVSATGFWAGQTLGRAGLGFVTERFGERLCISIYLAIAVAMELVFWLVPQFVVSAVAVALLGVFLGPLFPACVIMATKLLPSHLHVSAVGFGTAIGGTGGTVFPFLVGAIAQAKGVKVLQPIVMALLACITLIWLSFPRIKKTGEEGREEEEPFWTPIGLVQLAFSRLRRRT